MRLSICFEATAELNYTSHIRHARRNYSTEVCLEVFSIRLICAISCLHLRVLHVPLNHGHSKKKSRVAI